MPKFDKVTLPQVMEAVEEDDCTGFCLACGEGAMGVEPDARQNYECENCGACEGFGAEELLMMLA